ncbi:MAG: hypothetical protein ED556_04055 [Winogradskyella sp.]|uniref:hypothetical protein n=1 Tax=Winogradskyella sp. TaxID=1883156 RepID=UPI000F3ABE5C|nr:hypothetical protein [Winogradskyella sp.]RNC88368.1 MAG: hypothetical protein ED556_04055 [Winogradskyella sp.]
MFTFKRKLPIWKTILGTISLALGIYTLFSSYSAFILIGFGIYLLLVEGSEFDFKNRKYRKIRSILGIDIGKWEALPDIEYISVFKTNEVTTLRARSAEAKVKNEIFKLNLFYNRNKRIEAYRTYNIDDAFKKAKEIASLLNVDILDATERESKWI